MSDTSNIHTRALLVDLNISTWSARKYDRKVSTEVNQQYHAADDAGRYNKYLLPGDAASYKALVALASAIRVQHYAHTLAWSDEGWRLLPTANYMDYTTWFRGQQQAFNTAADTFEQDYPALRAAAQSKLNGLWQAEDYPSDVRSKFRISIAYLPLPAQGDIRVNLASDQIGEIEAAIRQQTMDAIGVSVKDAWQRLYKTVEHVAAKLSDPEAIFRNSLVENARDICDTLKRLNVTDDADLESMRQRVADSIATMDADTLRENKIVRADVADKAKQIMADMQVMYGGVSA